MNRAWTTRRLPLVGLAVAAAVALAACAKPKPPTITSVMPTSVLVKATGVTIGWELGMKNENAVAIPVQSVQAHVVIDDSMDLGTASVSEAVTLPSQKETVVPVSTDLAWSNMGQLGQLAMAQRDVKYKADGTVTLGGALLNVTVPFTATGVITQQDLVRGAMQGLPLLLPR